MQQWIRDGKPVDPPPPPKKGQRPRSPLQYAIHAGFHSLVQVLLEGGAEVETTWRYNAMDHALDNRRIDIAKLLLEHGARVEDVEMRRVFDTWQPEVMEHFIELGADVETDNPLAYALSNRIRTALRIFKKYRDRFPSFQEQANIALRHHCKDGNMKWVSLMLWAGADPHAKGVDDWSAEPDEDPDYGSSALELAASYNHYEVFKLKKVRLDPNHEHASDLLQRATWSDDSVFLEKLLSLGYDPNDQENGGSSVLHSILTGMAWSFYPWRSDKKRDIDNEGTRGKVNHSTG